jgi:hypothetical protein
VDEKEDGWWAYGVEPGALSETGDTPHEALFYYRQAYATVMADFARDAAGSFDRFQGMAQAFFAQKDEEDEGRWLAARRALGSDEAQPCEALRGLPREKAESPRKMLVVRLDKAESQLPAAVEEVALPEALPTAA